MVVTEIRKQKDMPYYYDKNGNKIYADMVINILGVPNRLNIAQLYEQTLNWCKASMLDQIQDKDYETRKEKIFRFIEISSSKQFKKMNKFFDKLSEEDKIDFIDDMTENGFSIEQPPLYGNMSLDDFGKLFDEFAIDETDVYVRKWGREKKFLNKSIIANKYVYKLKHHQLSGDINLFNCWKNLNSKSAA